MDAWMDTWMVDGGYGRCQVKNEASTTTAVAVPLASNRGSTDSVLIDSHVETSQQK